MIRKIVKKIAAIRIRIDQAYPSIRELSTSEISIAFCLRGAAEKSKPLFERHPVHVHREQIKHADDDQAECEKSPHFI